MSSDNHSSPPSSSRTRKSSLSSIAESTLSKNSSQSNPSTIIEDWGESRDGFELGTLPSRRLSGTSTLGFRSLTQPGNRFSQLSSFSFLRNRDLRLHRASTILSQPLSFSESIWANEPEDIELSFKPPFPEPPPPDYHIYTRAQKRYVVILVSAAALFSPLSSNIYFPVLNTIANDLNTSTSNVNFSVTIYLIFQGLAPSFWGPLADSYGRRPIFIGTFLVYMVANTGLGLSRSYAALMVFRGLQAIGSSATIAIGSGVISDITTRSERAGLMGIFAGLRMFGQAFGPVLGGVMAQYLGFRSIFWFLLIFSGLVLLTLIVFLPETLRRVADNGSVPLHGIYKPLVRNFTKKNGDETVQFERQPRKPVSIKTFLDSFKMLFHKDIFCTLLFGSVIYTAWSMVTASNSALFTEEYGLNDTQNGLVFLPNGLGCVLGSIVMGTLMDRDFKIVEKKFRESRGLSEDVDVSRLPDFPLERARLRNMWWIVIMNVGCIAAYGWTLESHIAIPLTLQFFSKCGLTLFRSIRKLTCPVSFSATAVFNINSTMIVDLYPSKSASATAIVSPLSSQSSFITFCGRRSPAYVETHHNASLASGLTSACPEQFHALCHECGWRQLDRLSEQSDQGTSGFQLHCVGRPLKLCFPHIRMGSWAAMENGPATEHIQWFVDKALGMIGERIYCTVHLWIVLSGSRL